MAALAAAEGSSEFTPGTRIGHYEILGELGRGGMGVVYRAHDEALGRDVALKSPLPEQATEDDRRRFLTEARAASRISHPGIVPIFEAFEARGRPWLAMALAEGRPLREVLAERAPLPLEDVVRHGLSLAEALEAAHAKHVLHRDVTPNNIFVAAGDRVVLMDFGLARFFIPPGEESRASTRGSDSSDQGVAGTLGYMSPEQLLGRPLDAATDLFALGAVLYEMATGVRAFPGRNSGEITDATLHRDPAPIARFVHDVPPELERILRKALTKRPDERHASARDLLVDLRALQRKMQSGQTTPPEPPVGRRWARSRAAAAAVLVGTAAIALLIWALSRPQGLPTGVPRQLTTGVGWEAEPAISPDGTMVVYVSEEANNTDIWIIDAGGGEPLRLTTDPATDDQPAWFPDGSALAFVSDRGGRRGVWKVPRLGGTPSLLVTEARDPAISPDGTRIAFVRSNAAGDSRIFVAPLNDPGTARMITADGEGLWDHVQPAWSRDGALICYAAQRDLWVVPAAGGHARGLTTDGEYHREPVWSPDGRFVYFSSAREGSFALWRVAAGGGRPVRITPGSGPERHPSLSFDGARLAYSTLLENTNVVVRDLVTGAEREVGGLRDEDQPVLSPDRRAVAFISDRRGGRIDLWLQPLTAGGEPEGSPQRLTDQPGSPAQPSFSPDGRWIAYQHAQEAQRDVWIAAAAGGAPVRLTDDPAADIQPDWSPDGRAVVFVSERSGAPQLWVVPVAEGRAAGRPRQVTTRPMNYQAPAWSPDGARIAFIGWERGEGDIWTIAASGGQPVRVTTGANARRVAWKRESGSLLISGFWGERRIGVREVSATGAAKGASEPLAWLGHDELLADFDVSRDGRLLVFGRQDRRGDVWVVEAQQGKY